MSCGSPMRSHSKMTVLDPQIFAANTLVDSKALAAALRTLESCLAGPEIPLDLIVQDLCSVPHLFEFIVSALPGGQGLVNKILDTYPTDPALVNASYTSSLLQRVSSFIFALPPDHFSALIVRQIGQYKVYVEDALPILTLLYSVDISTGVAFDDPTTVILSDFNNAELSGFFVCSREQKGSERKNMVDVSGINVASFHRLGIKVPLNHTESLQKVHEITNNLKMILKFYLELLLEPSLSQHLKDAYVSVRNSNRTLCRAVPQETKVAKVIEQKQTIYRKVQPMKVALHLGSPDNFGAWRIIISTNTAKKLRELANVDRKKCVVIARKLKQLSHGQFSNENQRRVNNSDGVPIYEAKVQQDLCLVYQIDAVLDYVGHVEQVIKIYGIYTHAQFDPMWNAMGRYLAGKGEEYSWRCMFQNQPVHSGGNIYLPGCFVPESLESDTEPTPLILSEDMLELQSLVLEKYITFSRAFLYSLIANLDVQHVFELSPREHRIVDCETSCFVMGRSGTGKTTTMVFKMLGIQREWQMHSPDSGISQPRQIFVTKSRILAAKVEKYFMKLLESLVLDGYSLEELKRMQGQNSTESEMVDIDDTDQVDIPQKYSLLQENHFPLFVTFDKLAQMIAADVLSGDDRDIRRVAKFFTSTDKINPQDSFVTYDVFVRTYWPHFPQPLLKGLEPWLVFSEFMGVIKGSEKALACPNGFMDEATYCGLSARSNPTFANHRQTLYALFEAYCKLKMERRHHDVADRTRAILSRLLGKTSTFNGPRVDYIYVDEAQDNLLTDALLLRLICRNPEGLFWAGDTAQTISAGSTFRFNDLKAFLYRIERDHNIHLIQDRSVTDPEVFPLAINYRSHSGIVNCAHSVIERITHFWPDAIDRLKPERGIVGGLKPVFFSGWDQDTFRYEQFHSRELGDSIEFGAHQCILVRDDKALRKLKQEFGGKEIGVVMTLYESKGLEFNDVLLFNFFEDSAFDASRWHVLLNGTEDEIDRRGLVKVHAPPFERDSGRFAGVCSELKSLYVGITRARKNLWIFDNSERSKPMQMIWTSRDEVRICTPGMEVPRLAVSSSPAEWESFGHDMFRNKKYPQAMHCFSRALQPRMVAISKAYHLREVARATVGVASRKAQREAFFTAADAFTTIGNDAPLRGKDKLQYYRTAAECYVRAGDHRKAALTYISAKEYDLAARHYRQAGLFDKTLEVLKKHSQNIPSDSFEELYTVCRLFYCTKQDSDRPRLPLFSTFEEELEFLEKYDLDFARAVLLESRGRYLEAAELHLSENRPFDAIKDFLKEKGSRDAIQKATKIILDGLWRRCSFAITLKDVVASQDVMELLSLSHELPIDFVDPLDLHELSMFQAISQADLASLEKHAGEFIKGNRKPAALLALDHFFSRLPDLKSYKVQEMTDFLSKFMEYARLLHFIIFHPDPLSIGSIKRLFCIREVSNTEYSLESHSFLYNSATSDRGGGSVMALSRNDVVFTLRKYLAGHLRERVMEENILCRSALVFSPCLTYIITDHCNRENCPQEHVKRDDLDAKRYNLRLGIHLQQICILQIMFSVNPYLQNRSIMLGWLTYLYEAFYPQSHVQGSIADLDLSLMPDARTGMRVMKDWVRDALINLHPGRQDFLTTVLRLTNLLYAFDRPCALYCINRAYFNAPCAGIPQLIYSDGHYVVEDIVKFFDGTQFTCISAGMKFLIHVLRSSQAVDLSVFCDCLEEVIGKISVSWRLSSHFPSDGLVLPRGLSVNKDFSSGKGIWIAHIGAMLGCVQSLLMHLQSKAASRSPRVDSRNNELALKPSETLMLLKTRLTPLLSAAFTSRICRALCFLSYNVSHYVIRQKVRDIFKSLRTVGPMQGVYMYRKYVEARDNEYLRVVVGYDIESKVVIEDLVQLLHKQRDPQREPPLRLSRIKHIYFTTPSEIPSLLSSQPVAARSDLHGEARAFTPQTVSQIEKAEDEKARPQEPDIDPVDEVYEEPEEALASNEPTLIHGHEPTEKEISAAEKIQAAYRTHHKHRAAQAHAIGRGLKAQKNAIFLACLKNVYASDWGRTPYRTLYLWALPRLVVCLDRVMTIAREIKGKTKGLLLNESHERLEELGKRTNDIRSLLKDGHELRERIEPNASMHEAKNRDKAEMKKVALEVRKIIERLPAPPPDIQEDIGFAYNLVMTEKQPARKPEKRELNVEDLYC